ncbi:MAG: hypothetical protein KDA75_01185 [Planctomycetaceae bacterium]|nr:hypothetical protein [Planctomycetaceae bacterium]
MEIASMPAPLSRRGLWTRIGLITLLLSLSAVPLIVCRQDEGSSLSKGALTAIGVIMAAWGMGAVFVRLRQRRRDAGDGSESTACAAEAPTCRLGWWREIATFVLFGALTWICFYSPMWQSYWRGADDAGLFFVGDDNPVWSVDFDRVAGRPLQMFIGPALSRALTPGRMDGYMWVTGGIWFFSAWLLYLIVRRVLPQRPGLAAATGALLLICPTEPSRFYVFSTGMSYAGSLCVLLLSFWMLLVAVQNRHTGWLLASCIVLGMTLLSNEGQFPLAVMGFLLIWAAYRDRRYAVVSAYAWFATLLLLSIRLITFFATSGGNSYQARQASDRFRDLGQITTNLKMQAVAIREYVDFGSLRSVGLLTLGAAAAAIALLLMWIQPRTEAATATRRSLRVGVLLSAIAIVLGFLPFLHIPMVFRTQFFSAPGQAVLVTLVVALIASRLSTRWGRRCEFACVGLLVLNGTVAAYHLQEKRLEDPAFERLTHVFQQVHGLAPDLDLKTLVLLHHDRERMNPIACNFCGNILAYRLLNTAVVQSNYRDGTSDVVTFIPEGIAVAGGTGDFCRRMTKSSVASGPCVYPYDRVVIFRMSRDGNLRLMDELPFELAPVGGEIEKYQPLAHLGASPPRPISFFRYESSLHVPADVIPHGQGFLLDDDWSPLCDEEGLFSRSGGLDAAIIVNPMGRTRRMIELEVAPTEITAGRKTFFAVVNQQDEQVGQFMLDGRAVIKLWVTLDPTRANVLSFRPHLPKKQLEDRSVRFLSLVRDANAADPLQQKRLQLLDETAPAEPEADIHDGSVRLGQLWSTYADHPIGAFRWAKTEAELIIPPSDTGKGILKLDLQPYASGVLELALEDAAGNALSRASVTARRVVELPYSVAPGRASLLKFRRTSERTLPPGDPGNWDFRAFGIRCEAVSDAEYEAAVVRLLQPSASGSVGQPVKPPQRASRTPERVPQQAKQKTDELKR